MLATTSTRNLAQAALYTALIALGAFITVPLGPVPFTLQPLFVLLAGLTLGARLGALSTVAYIVLGLVAPVYAGGTSGIGVLLGPTGGYLIGFVLAAAVAGALGSTPRASTMRRVSAALAGLIPLYVLGASWLALSLQVSDYRTILVGGVLQFLPLDVVKAVAAGVLAQAMLTSRRAAHSGASDHSDLRSGDPADAG